MITDQELLYGIPSQCLEDDRKKPRILCAYIFFNIFIMRILSIPSLLQLDILLRREKTPFLFPASDSTIARVLRPMWLKLLRIILKTISLNVIHLGRSFVDFIVGDGLYTTRDFFSFCINDWATME